MKAEELRIGNLVEKGGEWFIADFITIKMAHNYNPIPLTPDILQGCGFESMEGTPLFRKFVNGGQILFEDKELVLHVNGQKFELVIKCEYLHELQNIIYWIVKEELEVKLPVIA